PWLNGVLGLRGLIFPNGAETMAPGKCVVAQESSVVETRTLGRTGLIVSRIGLGLAALGRPGYINLGHGADLHSEYEVASMQSRAAAVLDAAGDQGVRYFDAARSYGQAETFLAHWLASRRVAPRTATVGSKWGYVYTAGWQVQAEKHEVKDHSLENL